MEMGKGGVMLGGKNVFFVALLGLLWFVITDVAASVSYDSRALTVNGQRRILISGSIHYPRSTPEMWPDLIRKAKKGGLDVIQTYVFWNAHETTLGHYNFEGRYDLVRFIKLVKEAGLYVHLRIGPYVCAEWNFGGFPVWLKYIPGISFRTNNGPFKLRMHKFTKKIVDMMKSEGLFESQGGPIILSQVENEYGALEYEFGPPGRAYTKWAARMAVGLDTGVPWVMCKQTDAPDPIINTCNGFYCDNFFPNRLYKPKLWTEAWTGWFLNFGGAVPSRPAEDLAFAVARFFQTGGVFVNYYMYHGGTNFGRTAGGRFVATSYDYDAPLDEYGLTHQPKWGHLKELHRAIKLCEPALLGGVPSVTPLGKNQEVHTFKSKTGECAAFLANYDSESSSQVTFANSNHNLPAWSISILPDCMHTVYNTARINAQTSQMKMTSVEKAFAWQSYKEDMASYEENTFTTDRLLEQLNVTRDVSDYLWYMTEVEIDHSEEFLKSGNHPVLTIMSSGDALNVFINGQLSGSVYGSLENPKLTFSDNVKLVAGINKISLLSMSVGLANVGPHFEKWNVGILGPVSLLGLNKGMKDLSRNNWSYKIGLQGEALGLHSLGGSSSVEWMTGVLVVPHQPLYWYKTTFNAPSGNAPLALDMAGMGKGEAWINGQSIGRYWPAYTSSRIGCSKNNQCNYAGNYTERKCRNYCGLPSQRWYHVPRSWLKASDNLLVVFEEMGGNPNGISLVKKEVDRVCSNVFEWQPSLKMQASGNISQLIRPEARLRCSSGQKISSIKFASFGTPGGVCGNFHQGSCHSKDTYKAFEKACNGKKRCKVIVAPESFGPDPCPNVLKKLSVEAVCTDSFDLSSQR